MTQELVKCTGLCRSFGEVRALDDVNLSLPSGRIIGLLGPNGSGKTTLIKILNGLLQPTSGEARIAGNLPGVETKKIISFLPDRGYFPEWMNVGDMTTCSPTSTPTLTAPRPTRCAARWGWSARCASRRCRRERARRCS